MIQYQSCGGQKLAHGEVHGLPLKCLTQSICKWAIGNKHFTMENSNSWFHWPHIFQMMLKCYNKKFSCSRGVTHSLFLSDNSLFFLLSPISLFFTSQKIPLHVCLSPPFYKYTSCSYLYNCPIASQTLRDIFLYFIGFLPSLILELWLLGGVCTI